MGKKEKFLKKAIKIINICSKIIPKISKSGLNY
jgi:hypothetical protein